MGTTDRADAHNPALAVADEEIYKQVLETVVLVRTTLAHVNLHVTDWVTAQQEDPILKTLIKRITNQKVQDLKHLLGDDANTEEGKAILQEQKKLMLYQGVPSHHHTLACKLEGVLWFMVPVCH